MKISVEEVSRLLAYAPTERRGGRQEVAAEAAASESLSFNEEAAFLEVSATAQEVQQVKKYINQLPDVRADRVSALKAQIENGTYHVSGEDIADLIIRRALADNSGL